MQPYFALYMPYYHIANLKERSTPYCRSLFTCTGFSVVCSFLSLWLESDVLFKIVKEDNGLCKWNWKSSESRN